MQNKLLCCCFASPRPSRLPFGPDEETKGFGRLKLKLAAEIEAMRGKGVTTFLTGMAPGPDLWCAELVLDLKRAYADREINLAAVIPYMGQSDRWPEKWRKRYYAVLQMADEAVALRADYAPRCLLQCGRYMVENSAHMIAVYGGEKGDIQYTVEYACKNKLDIVTVRPKDYITKA